MIKLASNSRQTRVKLTPNSRFYLIFENSRCYSEHSFRTPPMTCHIYGRSCVESKNRLTSQFSGRDSLQGKQAFIITGHGWVPKTGFFPTFLWSRLPQAKQVRSYYELKIHEFCIFEKKFSEEGAPSGAVGATERRRRRKFFLKTNKGEAKKQKKKAGLHYIGRPSFFAFLLHLQSRISWKPMNTTFDSASNARQTRGKRASNARQTRTKSFWNSQHLILVGI